MPRSDPGGDGGRAEGAAAHATEIFISYRRSDAGGHAGRLCDRLASRFGRRHVFFDTMSIGGGELWRDSLRRHLESCRVVLAVIGPDWLTARDAAGRVRLERADDAVRGEIDAALQPGRGVIPVLVGAAVLPSPDQLPPDWQAGRRLTEYNAVHVGHETFETDLEHLESVIRPWVPELALHEEETDASPAGATARSRLPGRVLRATLAGFVLTWATNALFARYQVGTMSVAEFAYVFVVWTLLSTAILWAVDRFRWRSAG